MSVAELTGEWTSRYEYRAGASSQHDLSLEAIDDSVLIGTGSDESDSKIRLELEYDPQNNVLTGVWQEDTSPRGKYRGETFHGAVQFIVNAGLDSAEGKWVGFNSSRDKVNVGGWWLSKKQN